MPNTNGYSPFGTGTGANVLAAAAWAALATRLSGFQSGIAPSQQVNTPIRQASVVATMIAQFAADYGPNNIADDGNVALLESNFEAALATFIQDGSWVNANDTSGAANVIVINPSPAITAYAKYQRFRVALANNITGPSTLNVNGLGAVAVKRPDGTSTTEFNGRAGQICDFTYDGTYFQIATPTMGLRASIFDQSVSTSAGGTLTAAQCGATIQLSPTTPGSPVYLPLSGTCANGDRLEFFHNGVAGQVLEVQGSDIIAMANGISLSQITLNTGDTLVLESTGVSGEWLAVGGSAQIGYSAAFGKSLTSAGYQKLPSGLILQWGLASLASGTNSQTITFPIAFPNVALAYGANDNGASNFAYGATCNTTQITVSVQPYYVSGSGSVIARAIGAAGSWWAIGH